MALLSEPIKQKSYWDDNMIRLRNPATRKYLHLTGTGEVQGVHYAWIGTRTQAEALRARAQADGAPWPYLKAAR